MGAYRDASKGKRMRDEVISFSRNLGENLNDIRDDLLNMTYTVGRYREFYVRYPKPRLVMALGFRDRIVQWAIYRQINPYLDKRYITHSYGCRNNKGTLAAVECLHSWQQLISRKQDAENWYIIKGDISKYFYRVDHDKVLSIYSEISDDAWFTWLMSTIINNPDVPFGLPPGAKPDNCPRSERLYDIGMPIGNLTSQETANLYLDKLDQYCKHVLHLHYYIRYMDDFCIYVNSKETAKNIFMKIGQFLREELLLDVSPKSRIQRATDSIEFVGYIVTPHGIRLRKKTTRHIKRSLKHIMNAYACGAIGYDRAMKSVVCYTGMCRKCSGYNMLRWIEDNFILQRMPPDGRRFYSVQSNEDGTVDVYLRPDPSLKSDNEQQIKVLIVKGVVPFDGIEDDIRARYEDWCQSAEEIYL